MLYLTCGEEQKAFLAYADSLISLLAHNQIKAMLQKLDQSCLTENEITLALRQQNADGPLMPTDGPVSAAKNDSSVECFRLYDGSGYHMDYELSSNGIWNDLTLRLSFLKKGEGYECILDEIRIL